MPSWLVALILAALIVLPILGGIVALLWRGKWVQGTALATAGLALALGLAVICRQYPDAPGRFVRELGSLPWIKGLAHAKLFGVLLDPLSALMLIVVLGIGFLVVLFSLGYISPRNVEHPYTNGRGRYYFWLLLFIGSMVGVAVSPNLLQLFVFWELTTLCSWALISHTQEEKALRAGFKALIMTHFGALFFLIALFVLFVMTESFAFSALGSLQGWVKPLVFMMLLGAAWAKAAQFPFHTWLPDAMEAPTPISAYLHAAAMVKAGVYLIARVVLANPEAWPAMGTVTVVMALVTMFMALGFFFVQDDLKRLLAYSTIAHLAYVLFAVGLGLLGSDVGYKGGLLHIICHGFAKSTLFLSVGTVAYAVGTRSIKALSGVGRAVPLAGLAFFVGALAVTGVPPFACFWSKFQILAGTLQLGGATGVLMLVLVLIESLISFGWFLRIGQIVFLSEPSPVVQAQAARGNSPAITAALIILMVMCVAAPVVGYWLIDAIPM